MLGSISAASALATSAGVSPFWTGCAYAVPSTVIAQISAAFEGPVSATVVVFAGVDATIALPDASMRKAVVNAVPLRRVMTTVLPSVALE